ncbi:MAG TPA: A24 family peptidase [Chloroflexota bacterium]|nr:A24 family peptidase [Chloroflexota bacterium]
MPLVFAVLGLLVATAELYLEPLLLTHRLDDPERFRHVQRLPMVAHLLPAAQSESSTAAEVEGGPEDGGLWPFVLTTAIFQLALAGTFAGLAWRLHAPWQIGLACAYSAILFQIGLIDFHHRLVLNILSYPAAVLAVAGSLFWSGIGLGSSLLGGLIALAIFLVIEIAGRGAMGRGDSKLAAVIGLMRGIPGLWTALISGILIGGVVALLLLVTGRSRKDTFAYGPWLAAGAILSFFLAPH